MKYLKRNQQKEKKRKITMMISFRMTSEEHKPITLNIIIDANKQSSFSHLSKNNNERIVLAHRLNYGEHAKNIFKGSMHPFGELYRSEKFFPLALMPQQRALSWCEDQGDTNYRLEGHKSHAVLLPNPIEGIF